jgi:hypothetical protein
VSRGWLIRPLLVDIVRHDTAGTRAASAYDDDFRTFVPGEARVELPAVRLPAQIKGGITWDRLRGTAAGNLPDKRVVCVFHYRDLETRGLLDTTNGGSLIRVGDRLTAIYNRAGTTLLHRIRDEDGGQYATEVAPSGLGLGGERNLLVVTFEPRALGKAVYP